MDAASHRSTFTAPIYVFSIPTELINHFQPRQLRLPEYQSLVLKSTSPPPVTQLDAVVGQGLGGAFTCTLTGASFPDLASLKEHYKTDWYKYNVKLRSQGKPTGVTEEQFDVLVEGLSASISGSDSSSSSEGSASSSTNAVSRLMRKQQLHSGGGAAGEEEELGSITGPRSAVLWFEAPDASPSTQYGIYRATLPVAGFGKKREDGPEVLEEIRSLQLPEPLSAKAIKSITARGGEVPEVKERKWTLMMFGGGHFAAMVVSLVPRLVSKGKGKEKEREVVIIEKKTFHRYTTRRKQGGSQAANDNAKGNAKSAGAALRRYNESALTDDIRDLLDSWRDEIAGSELIFLRASKTYYKTFFGYENAPLDKKDPRIRGFSFPTRRPTISELIRAFTELTRVKVSYLSADALAQLDAAYIASITPTPAPVVAPKKVIAPKPVVVKLSREEEIERDRWTRLVDMVRKGRIEAIAAFLEKYGPELEQVGRVWGALPSWMDESRNLPTLLHVAAAADQSEMVRWLLVEKRADPTLAASTPAASSRSTSVTVDTSLSTLPSQRPILTPYELAPSRLTRNVFRFLTFEHPEWWDWTGAGPEGARVPSGLSAEKEEEREKKAQEHRDRLREKQREREKEQEARERVEKDRVEAERVEKERIEIAELVRTKKSHLVPTGPRRLGGVGGGRGVETTSANTGGLTEAAQMRVERERRARAAEARFGK